MKPTFHRSKGVDTNPYTRLSKVGSGSANTGGIRRINGLKDTGRSPRKTPEMQIEAILQQTLRILRDIRGGRERHMSLEDFSEIADEVRSKLIELQIDTQEVDEAIEKARNIILRKE